MNWAYFLIGPCPVQPRSKVVLLQVGPEVQRCANVPLRLLQLQKQWVCCQAHLSERVFREYRFGTEVLERWILVKHGHDSELEEEHR